MNKTNHKKFKIILNKNLKNSGGQYNGYLLIRDENHKWYKKDYSELDSVSIHGELTFSKMVDEILVSNFKELSKSDIGSWMIGFSTNNDGDTEEYWTYDRVFEEVKEKLFYFALELYEGNKRFNQDYEEIIENSQLLRCRFCGSFKIETIDHNIQDYDFNYLSYKLIHCEECKKESVINDAR